jgi:beta-N-acetylglucosaminidase
LIKRFDPTPLVLTACLLFLCTLFIWSFFKLTDIMKEHQITNPTVSETIMETEALESAPVISRSGSDLAPLQLTAQVQSLVRDVIPPVPSKELDKSSGLSLAQFETALAGTGLSDLAEAFYTADRSSNVNGIFLASLAALESAWGHSRIARDKNNLFGWNAAAPSPYANARTFSSQAACIEYCARILTANYLRPDGKYYHGATLAAMNPTYCTNPQWQYDISAIMSQLYQKLR